MRFSAVVGLLLTMAVGTQAAAYYCQCLYSDSSHCCVAENGRGDCTATCMYAKAVFADNNCNAGGKFSSVSTWNAQWRTACHD
ncbi:hypothetical protein ACET3X_004375 [Alternaria dauci]|uniref:Extracellular membrane protein CFEM domain-containing protein n=1 Tax=Alternaria dauci TaxID=48095 RepID=A0ABR3UN64_9PLEO